MTRTNGILIAGWCVFLSISACVSKSPQTEFLKNEVVEQDQQMLTTALVKNFPGYQFSGIDKFNAKQQPTPHMLSGDFNGDGSIDIAAILQGREKWKLVVFFNELAGDYSAMEITSFPGADINWHTMLPENLKIGREPSVGKGAAEILRLIGKDAGSFLEFYWNEKTKTFATVRVNNKMHQTMVRPALKTTAPVTGTVTLVTQNLEESKQSSSQIDLEAKSTELNDEDDIKFVVAGGTMMFYSLDPINGASATLFGMSTPNYDDCLNLQSKMSEGNIPELDVGMHFCVKTNRQNFARIQIDSLDLKKNSITLDYQTWVGGH